MPHLLEYPFFSFTFTHVLRTRPPANAEHIGTRHITAAHSSGVTRTLQVTQRAGRAQAALAWEGKSSQRSLPGVADG